MDAKIIARVVKFSEGLLERKLAQTEVDNLKEFVAANIEYLKDKKTIIQIAELANEFVNSLNSNTYITDSNINISSILGLDTFDRFISEINPHAKRKIAYMCLDSRYAQFNPECTRLKWSFTNNLNIINNSTNVTGPVRDIVSIRMQSIVVRKFSSIPQRATILIEELAGQAFIMPSGRRFHFLGLLNDLQNPIALGVRNGAGLPGIIVPDFTIFDKYELLAGYKFNEGYYRFNKPITTLNDITISIGNPDTLVVLPKYEFTNITVLDVQIGHIDLELNEPHHYAGPNFEVGTGFEGTWYSVFIDGFTSNYARDVAYFGNMEFTYIQILSPTQIRVTDSSMPAGYHPFLDTPIRGFPIDDPWTPGAPWTCRAVRFNSYRVIMNFELEYISD